MEVTAGRSERHAKLRPWQHGMIFLLACVVIILRRPDAIFHAQLYAEDGHVWFADAYNLGWWHALFQAHTGYYQTLPRLGASLALLVPFALAPLVLNLIAIAVMAMPVNILLSSRSAAWGSLRSRALLASVYLVLPNCAEISNGITESQWLLALSTFLVLTASTPRNIAGRVFDLSAVLLCGLTGPFCILLLPLATVFAWKHRSRWRWVVTGILAVLCLIQIWALLVVDPAGRTSTVTGASPALLARILGGQVYLATLLGANGLATRSGLIVLFCCIAVGGTAFVAIHFATGSLARKLFLLFSVMLFAVSLISPTGSIPGGLPSWISLAAAAAVRYWFFPSLAFAWSLIWCSSQPSRALRIVPTSLLCLMCFGIVRDWRHPPLQDMHFAEHAHRFASAPAGETITIPLNPNGWNMQLVKHE